MINREAAWSLEYVYCSGRCGGMVQFDCGLTEARRHVSLDTEYDSIATVGEIRVYWRADFQSGSRVLKKVF